MLDDKVLESYINGFYGYGNFQSPFWFIGMEEGGGNSIGEIIKRISVWDNRGQQIIEDLFDYHLKIGITQFFGQRAKLQKTWSQLIRVIFGIYESDFENEKIREYQNRFLGRKNGETCLLELLPLPAPSINDWLYGKYSRIDYLSNREKYIGAVPEFRIPFIKEKIKESNPKAVVFYGSTYENYWTKIAGIVGFPENKNGIPYYRNANTIFLSAKHPAAKGITNEYFYQVGTLIKEEIDF